MNGTAGRITVRVADAVAYVELDNPTQRNAITRAMCLELQELMPRLDSAPDVHIITIGGAADTFSAGAQLGELASVLMDRQADGSLVDQLSRADLAIASVAKPTLALVDGACMGGGWQIASACDFIIASERSVFAITPAKLGLIYPRPGIERLVRQVGPAAAKFILFTGQTFSAARAASMGLIAEAVPSDEFEERCHRLLSTIAERSRFSIHHLKRLVDVTAADDREADSVWEDAWRAMERNPDLSIGVEAFLNREQPRFVWEPRDSES